MSQPDLTLAISQTMPPDSGVRVGTVTSVYPLKINLQGGSVENAGCLESYTPAIGDVVAMIRQDATWLVLGRTTAPSQPGALITRVENTAGAPFQNTAEQTAMTTPLALFPAGKAVRVRWMARMSGATVNSAVMRVRNGAGVELFVWEILNSTNTGNGTSWTEVGYIANRKTTDVATTLSLSYAAAINIGVQMDPTGVTAPNFLEAEVAPGPLSWYPNAQQV